jgi:hypothetical protein
MERLLISQLMSVNSQVPKNAGQSITISQTGSSVPDQIKSEGMLDWCNEYVRKGEGDRISSLNKVDELVCRAFANKPDGNPDGVLFYPGSGSDIMNPLLASHSNVMHFVFADTGEGMFGHTIAQIQQHLDNNPKKLENGSDEYETVLNKLNLKNNKNKPIEIARFSANGKDRYLVMSMQSDSQFLNSNETFKFDVFFDKDAYDHSSLDSMNTADDNTKKILSRSNFPCVFFTNGSKDWNIEKLEHAAVNFYGDNGVVKGKVNGEMIATMIPDIDTYKNTKVIPNQWVINQTISSLTNEKEIKNQLSINDQKIKTCEDNMNRVSNKTVQEHQNEIYDLRKKVENFESYAGQTSLQQIKLIRKHEAELRSLKTKLQSLEELQKLNSPVNEKELEKLSIDLGGLFEAKSQLNEMLSLCKIIQDLQGLMDEDAQDCTQANCCVAIKGVLASLVSEERLTPKMLYGLSGQEKEKLRDSLMLGLVPSLYYNNDTKKLFDQSFHECVKPN